MLSPLTFSPTTLTAHWMDSTLLPATSAFDLPFDLHEAGFDLPDAGRQAFGTPHVYYPVLPLDGEGNYRSPQIAFMKQVAANKKDPRWKDAGIGLGVGLGGVSKRCGVLQSSYVLSRQPQFVHGAEKVQPKPVPVPAPTPPAVPASSIGRAGSLWDALTEFVETAYSLTPPSSPTTETAPKSASDLSLPPVIEFAAEHVDPSSGRGAAQSPIQVPETAPSPVEVLTLEPIVFSPPASPLFTPRTEESQLAASPASPQVLILTHIDCTPPASPLFSRSVAVAEPPSPKRALSLPLPLRKVPRVPNLQLFVRDAQSPTSPIVPDTTAKSDRVSFVVEARVHNKDERPAWFAREEALIIEARFRKAHRPQFFVGTPPSAWDMMRTRCIQREAVHIKAERLAGAKRERKPRSTNGGLPYMVVMRQVRRTAEERTQRCSRWLKREEELAQSERLERMRVEAYEEARGL